MNATRLESKVLLEKHVKSLALRHHCVMVAAAMEAYAKVLGQDQELWYQAGLLHDLDWEEYPDEHPNTAIKEWLVEYPEELKHAIAAPKSRKTAYTGCQ